MNKVAHMIVLYFILAGLTPGLSTQVQGSSPRIVGVAHMAYYVTDLGKARAYYEGLLGFQEAFALKNTDGSDHIVFIKINDHQYIELVAEVPKNHGFLYDAGFETNDAKRMRDHLAALGLIVPKKVVKDATGNMSFEITDPSGFTIQIVQYLPGSLTGRSTGKFMPASRISTHIDHIGLLVDDRESSWKFYGDTFGFIKEGDGSKMALPGSEDRFELGVEHKTPTIDRYHVKDHICLSAPDVPKVTAELQAKPIMSEFPKAIADIHQLGSGKNVIEIYDQDGNRVELMEPPLSAQDAPAAASAAPTPAQCGIPGHHALLERMSAAFELNCAQEQKLEPLLHDEESVSKPLIRFAAFTPEEKKSVMLQVKIAARRQIRPLLTTAQQLKMDQEIDTVSKGGQGLQKGNVKEGDSKDGKEKKTEESVDPFVAEESLSDAIGKYAALSADEKKMLILKVKQASRRPDAPQMTPEQEKTVDASIKQISREPRKRLEPAENHILMDCPVRQES